MPNYLIQDAIQALKDLIDLAKREYINRTGDMDYEDVPEIKNGENVIAMLEDVYEDD